MDLVHEALDWERAILISGGGWPLVVLVLAFAFFLSMFCQWVGAAIALRPLRQSSPTHWADIARLAYPGWVVLSVGPLIPAFFLYANANNYKPVLAPTAHETVTWLSSLAGLLGALTISTQVESRIKGRKITLLDRLAAVLIIAFLFVPNLLVFVWMAGNLPQVLNAKAILVIGLSLMVAATVDAFDGGLLLARLIKLATPASARLQAIVDLAVQRVGTRPRGAYLLHWKSANALAFPLTQQIAVTTAAMHGLSDGELVAVCAHELAHLNEPRRIRLARFLGALVWMPIFALYPIFGSFGLPGVVLTGAVVLTANRLIQRLKRSMEMRADSIGLAHEGDAGAYARALEKLYQINLMPGVMKQQRLAHPHLYDRMLAAQVPPDYPRPNPPSRVRSLVALLAIVFCSVTGITVWMVLLSLIIKR